MDPLLLLKALAALVAVGALSASCLIGNDNNKCPGGDKCVDASVPSIDARFPKVDASFPKVDASLPAADASVPAADASSVDASASSVD